MRRLAKLSRLERRHQALACPCDDPFMPHDGLGERDEPTSTELSDTRSTVMFFWPYISAASWKSMAWATRRTSGPPKVNGRHRGDHQNQQFDTRGVRVSPPGC